jgi:hypothetical protein
MRKIAVAVAAAVLAVSAVQSHAHEIYSTVGSEGVGLGYGYSISKSVDVRADFNYLGFNHGGELDGTGYNATARLAHAGLYADWFPLDGIAHGLRLTAGALIGNDRAYGSLDGNNGSITINGHTLSTYGQSIYAKAKMPTVRPYIGIGYGHNALAKGFSFIADVGVAYGKPKMEYNLPVGLEEAVGSDNVAAQEAKWQDTANRVRFFPVVKLGAAYRF